MINFVQIMFTILTLGILWWSKRWGELLKITMLYVFPSTGCGGVTMGTVCIIWAGWRWSFLFTMHFSLDVVGKLNVWLYTSLLILDIVYLLYSSPIWVRPALKCQLLLGPQKRLKDVLNIPKMLWIPWWNQNIAQQNILTN